MEENAAERAENEVLLKAQVDKMRWRAELPELPRLTFARALRRILCPHNHTGGTIDAEMWVSWCNDCGHTEISLAPLEPGEHWLPEGRPASEGRPAWYSTPVRRPARGSAEALSFSLLGFILAFCGLALAVAWAIETLV